MADIAGAVPAKINGRYAITVRDIQASEKIPTKVHRGPFGNFGSSQAPEGDLSLSFKVSVPKDGFEFNWKAEFAKAGASITFDAPISRGFTGVKLAGDDISIDNAQGDTLQSVQCTAEHRVDL